MYTHRSMVVVVVGMNVSPFRDIRLLYRTSVGATAYNIGDTHSTPQWYMVNARVCVSLFFSDWWSDWPPVVEPSDIQSISGPNPKRKTFPDVKSNREIESNQIFQTDSKIDRPRLKNRFCWGFYSSRYYCKCKNKSKALGPGGCWTPPLGDTEPIATISTIYVHYSTRENIVITKIK